MQPQPILRECTVGTATSRNVVAARVAHLSCHTAVGTPPSVVSPRLAANAVGSPSFSYLEYRNCSAAVLIAEVSFSLSQLMRSAGGGCGGPFVCRADGAVSYYAKAHMMASCTGPPNVDFSDSKFNHVAHIPSRSCGEVEENVLRHARFSWRTPS